MKKVIDNTKLLQLRKKGWLMKDIGKHFGVSKQAIHIRLKNLGEDGLTPRWCWHCKKITLTVYWHHKWKHICTPCFEKVKRVKKYKWSCDYPCCIDCGRTSVIHNSKGRCHSCACKNKYQTSEKYRKRKIKDTLKYYHKKKGHK